MFNSVRGLVLIASLGASLTGCLATASNNCQQDAGVRLLRTPTEFLINNGIKSYDEQNYADAMKIMQTVVETSGATKAEKVLAFKYLAFMHCLATNETREFRERTCRDSFQRALDLDPNFDLAPAEAGHPLWKDVFKNIKHPPSK